MTDTENRVRKKSQTAGLRPFQKGKSGNPGGRPKGLAALIRAQTKDGKELVDLMLNVMRGNTDALVSKLNKAKTVPEILIRDRMQAVEYLTDRGFGKCLETVELTGKDGKALYDPALIAAAQAVATKL